MTQTHKLLSCGAFIRTFFAWAILASASYSNSYALSLYVGQGAGTKVNDSHYYYGGSRWPDMTATIDAAFSTVTVAPDLLDLDAMLAHDRLWVDVRSVQGDLLSPIELANIEIFISTGKRTVLMGERGVTWSTQILSIVGGEWAGEGIGIGMANALPVEPALTAGVGSINFSQNAFGQSFGGTPLFDRPWSTLWDGSVLTALDAVVFSQWDNASHARYGRNVVQWLAVAEPHTAKLLLWLVVFGGSTCLRPLRAIRRERGG